MKGIINLTIVECKSSQVVEELKYNYDNKSNHSGM